MSVDFRSTAHFGSESHHYYRQPTAPTASDPLQVGDLWSDTTANLLKRCTSVSPITFVSVEGGSSSHDLFSTVHGDVDEADTPTDGQILKFNNAAAKWRAEDEAAGHGDNAHDGTILSDVIASRPAAGTVDRFFWATDEHVLYRDTGAAWVKASVADHADLDGIGFNDHHAQTHSDTDHTAGFGSPTGNIDIGDAAAEGAAATHSRSDHQHTFTAPGAGYPQDVAAAEADGVAATPARSDHVHAHGSGYSPDAHHARSHDHAAAGDGTTLTPAVLNIPNTATPAQTAEGQAVWDNDGDELTVGTGGGRKILVNTDRSHDIEAWISGAAMKGTQTLGAGDANRLPESDETTGNPTNYDYIAFDQTIEEEAFWQWAIPTGWNEGTITFRVYWTCISGVGGVVFGLKGLSRSDDDTIDAPLGTEVNVSDTLIVTEDVHITPESAAVTIGGTPAEGDLVIFGLSWKTGDGGDTLNGDARVMGVKITYTRNSYTD